MSIRNHRISFASLGLALALFSGACQSDRAYRDALEEQTAENKRLREERTQIKGDNRDLNFQKESLENAVAEANAKLLEMPRHDTSANAKKFPELDSAGVGYGLRDGEMVITMSSDITFASGKAELSKAGRSALASVAKALTREYPKAEYRIEGHTDSDPITKAKFGSNRDLSLARAMTVLHYLVEDAGVPDDRCVIVGWGQYRPVAEGKSADAKSKNRRVEIVVHAPKD
ncbi:MAG TPA: OmpA family protein [Planctomycetota bacterium]|nr:OmpA family protein [Planctomycetota bacterium]